jgi:hypothetical protein
MITTQLVCPKCHYEFQYDNGYYDREIARLGSEIHSIKVQLAEHNSLPWPQRKANQDWWERSKKALTIKQKQYSELKSFRKLADQQRKKQEDIAFKQAVKDRCGEDVYQQCLRDMLETVEGYSIASLARQEFSSKTGHAVTSVAKL